MNNYIETNPMEMTSGSRNRGFKKSGCHCYFSYLVVVFCCCQVSIKRALMFWEVFVCHVVKVFEFIGVDGNWTLVQFLRMLWFNFCPYQPTLCHCSLLLKLFLNHTMSG